MIRRTITLLPVFLLVLVVLGSLSVFAGAGVITSRDVLGENMSGKTVYLVANVVRSNGNNYTWQFTYLKPALELVRSPYNGYLDVISNYSLVIRAGTVNITSYVVRIAWNKTGLYIYKNGTITKKYKNINVTMGYDTGWLVADGVIGFVWKSVVFRDGKAYEYGWPAIVYGGRPFFVIGSFNATGRVGLVLKPVYGGSVVRIVTSAPYTGSINKIAGQYNNTLVLAEGGSLYYYIVSHNLTFAVVGLGAFVYVLGNYFVFQGQKIVYNITGLHDVVVSVSSIPTIKGDYVMVPVWTGGGVVADNGWVIVGGEKQAFYREINRLGRVVPGIARIYSMALNGRYPFFSAIVDCFGVLGGVGVVRGWVVLVNDSFARLVVDELPVVGNMTVNITLWRPGLIVPVRDGGLVLRLGRVVLVLPLSQDKVKPLLEEYGLSEYVSPSTSVVRTTSTTPPATSMTGTTTTTHTTTTTPTTTHNTMTTAPVTAPSTTSAGGSGGIGWLWVIPIVVAIIIIAVILAKHKH